MRRYRYSGPAPSRRCIPGKKGIAVESEPARERTRDSEMPDVENQPRKEKEGGEVEVAGRMVLIRLLRDRDLFGAAGGEGGRRVNVAHR